MYKNIALTGFIFISPAIYAKNWSLDLFALAGESDNSLKTLHNEIDEQQNRYSASVAGDWQAEWASASLGYTALQEDYADDSEEEQSYLQGDSAIHLGSAQSKLNLDVQHSRRNLLKDVSERPSSSNQEERDTLQIRPSARINLGSKNELMTYAEISQTRYEDTRLRNSDRDVYGVEWLHRISSADSLHLDISKTESDFLYFQQPDYSMESVNLKYEIELRKLSYLLSVGQQKVEPVFSDSFDSTQYEASFNYKFGESNFRVFAEKAITDTSFGQGLDLNLTGVVGIDTAANQMGLIERTATGVDLQTNLSARNLLTLGYTEFDDYYKNVDASANQRTISASLAHRFSSATNLVISHAFSDQEMPPGETLGLKNEYQQVLSKVVLQFRSLQAFSWGILYERERRRTDLEDQNYTENYTGIFINFHLE